MLSNQVKTQSLQTSIVDCAIVDMAVCDTTIYPTWTVGEDECSNIQPQTSQCALVDIAVAGWAIAGWDICECSEPVWILQKQINYEMPNENCSGDEINVNRF